MTIAVVRSTLAVLLLGTVLGCDAQPGQPSSAQADALARQRSALDVADCPAGYRLIRGTPSADVLNGTSGNDCILGYGGDDQIFGKGGSDFLVGGDGADRLSGGAGADTLHGEAGPDVLHGDGSNDLLVGGEGDDVLDGDDNADQLRGGPGDDALFGDSGNDALEGDDGDDALLGGGGSNTVNGGAGIDACTGTACEKPPLTITGCTSNSQCSSGKICIADFGLCLGCVSDQDADAVCDSKDGCPQDAAKTAPLICGCGVAETDSDADGTPNCTDGCAEDAAKTAPGACGCGVSDADGDGDGTPDCSDACAADPAKTAPGLCGCGVSDADSDADGTPNCNDGCPADASKVGPGLCGCGVSDADSDADGTADCHDGCASDASKVAPGACGCGVSDADSDGDGALDCSESCDSDPSKVAPGICGCGTADVDSDEDGTADCNDGCPTDPRKLSPGVCGCGDTEQDSDGDGVFNCEDQCSGYPDDDDQDGDGIPDGCDLPTDCTENTVGVGVHRGDAWVYSDVDLMHLAGVTCVTGSLRVNYSSVTSLTALSSLREVVYDVMISGNDSLSSLAGLESLSRIGGGLYVDYNPQLTTLEGLDGLTEVDSLHVLYNDNLLNLQGLDGLEHVYSWLAVTGNNALTDITALYGLSTLGSPDNPTMNVTDNPALPACQPWMVASQHGLTCEPGPSVPNVCMNNGGVGSCGSLPEGFVCEPGASGPGVWDGDLTIYEGDTLALGGLTCVTGSVYINGTSISSLAQLGSLELVGGALFIEYNPQLTTLDGLHSLREVGGMFALWGNEALTDVSALANLTSIGKNFPPYANVLSISFNTALPQCAAWDIAGRAGKSCAASHGSGSGVCEGNEGEGTCAPLPADFECVPGARGPGVHDEEAYLYEENQEAWEGVRCITRDLSVYGMSDLSMLSSLQMVGGSVTISNNDVTNVDALSQLTSIHGGLYIAENPVLSDLEGLAQLEELGSDDPNPHLRVVDNASLPSCAVWPIEQKTGAVCGSWSGQGCVNGGTGSCGTLSADFACVPGAMGPGVYQGDLWLDVQDHAAFTGVTCVTGNLVVSYTDDISVLGTLQKVGGGLFVDSTQLTNVDALENLSHVESHLSIQYNGQLTDLSGLANLASVGVDAAVSVSNNFNLPACWLWMLEQNLGRDLDNWGNEGTGGCGELPPDFACVPGARGPGVYDGDVFYWGNALEWDGLTCVTGLLSIYQSDLTDLTAFHRLEAVGGNLELHSNYALTSVAGLENLTTVGGQLAIGSNGSLQSLAGLSSLTSVGAALEEGSPLSISYNEMLPACWVSAIEQQTGVSCGEACLENLGEGSCTP